MDWSNDLSRRTYDVGMRVAILAVLLGGCGRIDFADHRDGSTGDGPTAMCSAEVCNGIDDDCDGLIDEGCPCAPFSVSATNIGVQPWLVSEGVGWATASSSAFYRIDDSGSITASAPGPQSSQTTQETVAWTGENLVYLAGTNLVFASPAGDTLMTGPALDVGAGGYDQVSWDGQGFAVASGFSEYTFVTTDAEGVELASTSAPGMGTLEVPVGISRRNNANVVAWYRDGTLELSTPAPPAALDAVAVSATGGQLGTMASDGHRVLLLNRDANFANVYAIDDTGITLVPLSVGAIFDVGWTGDGWDLVTLDTTGPIVLRRIHLDASLAVASNDMILSVPFTGSFGVSSPILESDARRTLILFGAQVDSGPQTLYEIASCH